LQHDKNWLRDKKLREQCLVNSIPLKIAAIEAALDMAVSGWEFTWLIADI